MLKKRVIFTLLFDHGSFMLSRNFRLQRVGDLRWLQKNYNFYRVAFSIDELIVLDVSRDARQFDLFCEHLKSLTEGCFMPIAAGGGIRSVEQAKQLLRSGADKIVINTPIFENPILLNQLAVEFGQQCIIASVDASLHESGYRIMVENGSKPVNDSLSTWLQKISNYPIGELYLNSIHRDGTGQGYDLGLLDQIPETLTIPVILAGGAGNYHHLAQGLKDPRVDAVATAHLFNFIGDGLEKSRQSLIESGFDLAQWEKFKLNPSKNLSTLQKS
ncbi:MAG: imidazole glycerol phosphate synthase subunit HisF [Candidatus Omnitrophica bacterium]|nr:imidazole glycerol phosphate synthase subunit HisF [Candidatus Omnitrophota bacterium]